MQQENLIIHGLWIGQELSSLEWLTLKSFTVNGHFFYLWVYENIRTPLPQNVFLKDASKIIPKEKIFNYRHSNQYGHGKGSYAGFSDVFRYALLYKYGGWWVDMDVTCIKPFDFNEPYVFRSHHIFNVVGNIMKCPPQSELMKRCYDESIKIINAENTDWNKPIEILNHHINELSLNKYIKTISNNDQWRIIKKYIRNNKNAIENFYAIHWVNEEWRHHRISKNTVLKNSLLQQLYLRYEIPYKTATFFKATCLTFKTTTLFHAMLLLKNPKHFFDALHLFFKKK